ncbi:MAG: tryptophan-rich sensory protein [Chloroflexota bacterium]
MKQRSAFRVLNGLAVAATLAVNALANILPINGQNTGEIANRFAVYFLPAGYVFSIWGVIYAGLIAYAIFQALPSQQTNPRLRRADAPFLLSNLGNAAWLLLWHYNQYAWSMLPITLLLVSLAWVYQALGTGRPAQPGEPPVSSAERWMARLPFAIYLGWASVAVIANATAVLDYVGWSGWGFSESTWAVIMLGVAALLGLVMSVRRGDAVFNLVLAWAFAGIGVRLAGGLQSAGQLAERGSVAQAAYLAAGAALLLAALAWFFRRRSAARIAG